MFSRFCGLPESFFLRGGKGFPDLREIITRQLLQACDGEPPALFRLAACESRGGISLQKPLFLPDGLCEPLRRGKNFSVLRLFLQLLQAEEDLLLRGKPVRPAAELLPQRIRKQADQAQLLIEGGLFQLFSGAARRVPCQDVLHPVEFFVFPVQLVIGGKALRDLLVLEERISKAFLHRKRKSFIYFQRI